MLQRRGAELGLGMRIEGLVAHSIASHHVQLWDESRLVATAVANVSRSKNESFASAQRSAIEYGKGRRVPFRY